MRVLIGIIIVLVLIIGIGAPITLKEISKLQKEMVAKDTVISSLQNDNKQLNDRLVLVQKLNDDYNKTISNIQIDTQKYHNDEVTFSMPSVVEKDPVGTATKVNIQMNSIFSELGQIGRDPITTKTGASK